MNARMANKLLARDGFTSPRMVRALIEATTNSVPPRRKPRGHRSASLPFALLLVVVTAAALAPAFFR